MNNHEKFEEVAQLRKEIEAKGVTAFCLKHLNVYNREKLKYSDVGFHRAACAAIEYLEDLYTEKLLGR
ncbi:MAG: hypothetical protein AAF609_23235 [Cyanobacteria bacterium P01_C01_bin.120]